MPLYGCALWMNDEKYICEIIDSKKRKGKKNIHRKGICNTITVNLISLLRGIRKENKFGSIFKHVCI